jgi:hypothetical protein
MTTMSASPEAAPSEDPARRWADNYLTELLDQLEREQRTPISRHRAQ